MAVAPLNKSDFLCRNWHGRKGGWMLGGPGGKGSEALRQDVSDTCVLSAFGYIAKTSSLFVDAQEPLHLHQTLPMGRIRCACSNVHLSSKKADPNGSYSPVNDAVSKRSLLAFRSVPWVP